MRFASLAPDAKPAASKSSLPALQARRIFMEPQKESDEEALCGQRAARRAPCPSRNVVQPME